MIKTSFIAFALFIAANSCVAQTSLSVDVTNPYNIEMSDAPVVISLKNYPLTTSSIVICNGIEIPSQVDDLDGDGNKDELCFMTDIKAKGKKTFKIMLDNKSDQKQYKNLTFAELLLRNPKIKDKNKHDLYLSQIAATDEMKDQYHLLHHHGVAFENELICMRFYFDERQTLDLYGKFHKGLELKDTQFYTTKEQKQNGYGDDVLWVGDTFGLGALRGWNGNASTMISDVKSRGQRVVCYGPVRTIVELTDNGWRYKEGQPRISLTERYTLYANHRDVDVEAWTNRDSKNMEFSTGLINMKNSLEYTDHNGLRGLWGTDWPAGNDTINWKRETVGMGIYIPQNYRVKELPTDKDNYGFVIRMVDGKLNYRLTYSSADESFGYHNSKSWFEYLKEWKKNINLRPIIKIKRG